MNIQVIRVKWEDEKDTIVDLEYKLESLYQVPYYKVVTKNDIYNQFEKYKKEINFLFIKLDNKTIGFIEYTTNKDYGKFQINSLFVKKEHRSKGIGKVAIDECKKIAKQDGYTFLRLNVEKANQKGLSFYKREGFKVMGYKMEYEL